MSGGDESEEDDEDPIPLRNLRSLVRKLREDDTALKRQMRLADEEARAILAHFDEEPPPDGALIALHKLLVQVANFANQFKLALYKVRQHQNKLAKGSTMRSRCTSVDSPQPPTTPPSRPKCLAPNSGQKAVQLSSSALRDSSHGPSPRCSRSAPVLAS